MSIVRFSVRSISTSESGGLSWEFARGIMCVHNSIEVLNRTSVRFLILTREADYISMLIGRHTCHKRNAFLFNLKDEKVHMSEGISLFLLEMCTEECNE